MADAPSVPFHWFGLLFWLVSAGALGGFGTLVYWWGHRGYTDRQRFFLFCWASAASVLSLSMVLSVGFRSCIALKPDFKKVVERPANYLGYLQHNLDNFNRRQRGLIALKLYGAGTRESVELARRFVDSLGTSPEDQDRRVTAALAIGTNRHEMLDLIRASKPDRVDPLTQVDNQPQVTKSTPPVQPQSTDAKGDKNR
jgi:hypothetical protein